jgi:hypothetical protein
MGTVDFIINIVWILMAPAILIYLALTYKRGADKIAREMEEDEREFEEDLMATYAPLKYAAENDVMEAYEEVAEEYKGALKKLAEEGKEEDDE